MKKSLLSLALLLLLGPGLQGCAAVVVGGAAGGAMVANDKRTLGTYINDQEVELKAARRISQDFPQAGMNVSVTSFNGWVLLTGQVPSDAIKQQVQTDIARMSEVRQIFNELQVAGKQSLASEANDAAITAAVKTRLINTRDVNFDHVKVVTQSNVVYLMGLVSHQEGQSAIDVAATTSGVAKVVPAFEYTDQ